MFVWKAAHVSECVAANPAYRRSRQSRVSVQIPDIKDIILKRKKHKVVAGLTWLKYCHRCVCVVTSRGRRDPPLHPVAALHTLLRTSRHPTALWSEDRRVAKTFQSSNYESDGSSGHTRTSEGQITSVLMSSTNMLLQCSMVDFSGERTLKFVYRWNKKPAWDCRKEIVAGF